MLLIAGCPPNYGLTQNKCVFVNQNPVHETMYENYPFCDRDQWAFGPSDIVRSFDYFEFFTSFKIFAPFVLH